MRIRRATAIAGMVVFLGAGLAACDGRDNTFEQAGERMDRSLDRAGESVDRAGENVERAGERASERIGEALEDARERVDGATGAN